MKEFIDKERILREQLAMDFYFRIVIDSPVTESILRWHTLSLISTNFQEFMCYADQATN